MAISSTLPLLLPFLSLASASPAWTTSNISEAGPFGIPAETYDENHWKAAVAGHIAGYDVSLPASNTTPSTNSSDAAVWWLDITFTPDAPLSDASSADVDKSEYTDVTVLGLYPNDNATTWDEDGWRVCATVFVGGVPGATATQGNPSCGGVLSDECVAALQAAARSGGLDGDGRCQDVEMPEACGAIGAGGQQVTTGE